MENVEFFFQFGVYWKKKKQNSQFFSKFSEEYCASFHDKVKNKVLSISTTHSSRTNLKKKI